MNPESLYAEFISHGDNSDKMKRGKYIYLLAGEVFVLAAGGTLYFGTMKHQSRMSARTTNPGAVSSLARSTVNPQDAGGATSPQRCRRQYYEFPGDSGSRRQR
jgi:hypothetical protein